MFVTVRSTCKDVNLLTDDMVDVPDVISVVDA
jgi:hypothetical protein